MCNRKVNKILLIKQRMQNLMSQTDTVTIDNICYEHMSVVETEYTSYNRNLSIVVAGCYNINSVDVTLYISRYRNL